MRDSLKSERIANDSRIAKVDTSRCRAQYDEVLFFFDCHDSALPNLAMTNQPTPSLRDFALAKSWQSNIYFWIASGKALAMTTNGSADCFGDLLKLPRNDGVFYTFALDSISFMRFS